eukprot:TRINITY_DN1052_c0_g1_i21.p2 TRINITY_DN1052_c0_g1~~TRINITY_DN1052_c0_g1_i21.p2  ORF type:complete len:389 (-),score=78.56 TRINITY_DN1052_c0_g1_i21:651-1817(-)
MYSGNMTDDSKYMGPGGIHGSVGGGRVGGSDNAGRGVGGVRRTASLETMNSFEMSMFENHSKTNMKLARNRESARNSRRRKKVYIELLEKKVGQLRDELTETKERLEQSNKLLQKSLLQNKMTGMITQGANEIFDRIEMMLQSGKIKESDVLLLLEKLQSKYGCTSPERFACITAIFKQFTDIAVPSHVKSLLFLISEGDISAFSNEKRFKVDDRARVKQLWDYIITELQLDDRQRGRLGDLRKRFSNESTRIQNVMKSLTEVRNQFIEEFNSLRACENDFRTFLKPVQVAKLYVILNKIHVNESGLTDSLRYAMNPDSEKLDLDDLDKSSEEMEDYLENKYLAGVDDLPYEMYETVRKKLHKGELLEQYLSRTLDHSPINASDPLII